LSARRAYHHGSLRPALIAAALRELARHGLEELSLRRVAQRAGVSPAAVYRHFRDRDDLLVAVAAECAGRLGAAISAAVAAAPVDPLARFRATGVAVVRFAVANPEHFRALSMPGLTARTPPDQLERQRDFQAAQRRALADAQARGLIADLPLDDLLLTATTAINGLAQAIIAGQLGVVDDARATELAEAVTRVLGEGLVPRNARRRGSSR
jgi:AcrR family transcriptional regulator